MDGGSSLERARRSVIDRILPWSLGAFIVGFFFLPSKAHVKLFYVTVLPFAPFVLSWATLRTLLRSRVLVSAFAYNTYFLLSLIWAEGASAEDIRRVCHDYVYLTVFLALFSAFLWQKSDGEDAVQRTLIWAALAGAVVSCAVFYSLKPFPYARLQGLGAIDEKTVAAAAFSQASIVAWFRYSSPAPLAGGIRTAVLKWSVLCLLILAVVLTRSRASIASLLVIILAGALLLRDYRRLLAVGLVAAALVAFFAAFPHTFEEMTGRTGFRPTIWNSTLDKIGERPLLGHGITAGVEYGSPPRTRFVHPHQLYLTAMLQGGVVGLALLLALLGSAFSVGWTVWRREGRFVLLGLILHGCIIGLVDHHRLLYSPNYTWLVYWIPIAWAASLEVLSLSRPDTTKGVPEISTREG